MSSLEADPDLRALRRTGLAVVLTCFVFNIFSRGIGDAYTVTIPSGSFTRQGDRFVATGAAGGPPSAVLDYRRELLTVRARDVDLGAFAEGAQPLEVTVTLGNDARTNRVRAVKRGKALRY